MKDIKTNIIFLLLITIFALALSVCPASAVDEGTITINLDLGETSDTYNVLTYSGSVNNANFTTLTWDFGDGSTDTTNMGVSKTHTYSDEGSYTVTVNSTSSFDENIISNTGSVEVEEPEPLQTSTITIDSITASGTTWADYNIVTYSGSISNGTASSWSWDFGDSSSAATGSSTGTHTYSEAGTYDITLTVTSEDSTVSNTPTKSVTITEPPLVVTMDLELDEDDEELTYASTTDGAVSWSWDFDDDSTDSTLESGTHIYTKSDEFSVKLTVTSPAGNTSSKTETVELDKVVAYFTTDKASGSAPLTVKFEDESDENDYTDDDIVQWVWDFDDGSTNTVIKKGTDPDITHIFTKDGDYDVTLTVTDDDEDTDSYKMIITVDDDVAPTAEFGLYSDDYDKKGKAPFAVRFIDESEPCEDTNSTINTWYWEFINENGNVIREYGPGDSSYYQNPPSYTFSEAGLYTIQLTVTDEDGATDTETKKDFIEVTLGLSATFTASPTSGNSPLTVSFTAADGKDNDYAIDTYYWTFGDGSIASTTTRTTSHTYTKAGTFTPKLKVTDEMGYTYTYTRENYITVNDISSATAAPTYTIAPTSTENTVITTDASAGTKIFGLPGTEFFRSEMTRFYGFYDEYLSLLIGIFGMS